MNLCGGEVYFPPRLLVIVLSYILTMLTTSIATMFGLHNYEALPVIAELSLILIFTGAIGHFITIVWGTYCDQTLSHHTFIISCCGNYGYSYYQSYSSNPWARDGQVSAYIVSITHRVTGQVIDVHVEDNSKVKKAIFSLKSIQVFTRRPTEKHLRLKNKRLPYSPKPKMKSNVRWI